MGAIINRANYLLNNPRDDLLEECDLGQETFKSRSPLIQIQLYNFFFPALIDTGSEICAISEEVWSQIEEYHGNIPAFSCSGIKVTGAFKVKQRRVKQQVLLTFNILKNNITHEFLLIPDLVYPVIIGADLLRLFQVNINLSAECVFFKINNNWVSIPELNFTHELPGIESMEMKSIHGKSITCLTASPDQSPPDSDFAEILEKCNLTSEQKIIFKNLLEKHKTLFSDKPGLTTEYVHDIRLKDTREFCMKQYPVPIAHKDAIQKQLNLMEEWGVIRRTATPYINPIMTTLKKDNTVRICLDARHLNSVMEREYETPKPIEEIVRTFKKINYMSSCDFTHGYWQIPLSLESQKYTGFRFNGKTYVFRTLPFGLSTSVSTFSRCLSLIFGEPFEAFTTFYVDDILVVSETFEQHLEHLDKVFTRLKAANFTLRLKKCAFFREQMPFLGYVINASGIMPDPSRIQAIVDYTTPCNVKQLQRFLGMANYDRAFCREFSKIAAPLTNLCRKKVPWRWTQTEQGAFTQLKDILSQATLLYHPREDLPYCLATDASDVGLGAQLFQIVEGERRVVAWASRLLLERETRYNICERELLCVIWALSRFRIFLLGRQFTIYTDNSSITYLRTCRLLSARIARYALAIQEYDFVLQHIPGVQNIVADALSRHAAVRPPCPSDKLFKIVPLLQLPKDFINLLKNISAEQLTDEKLGDIIRNLPEDTNLQKRFVMHKDKLYLRRSNEEFYLLCIPKSLTTKFIAAYHNSLGHFGSYKTWRALRGEVWWNNMVRDIKRFIRNCEVCQKSKCSSLPDPPLHAIVPSTKGELVALDLYGPLPKSRGGVTYVLVLIDVFTKYVKFYALKKATTRACLNRILTDYLPKVGCPKRILSDHGTQFTATRWKDTLLANNIQLVYSSVRRPQSNPAERVMREIGRLCRAYCSDQQSRWAYELPKFEQFINLLIHESTGYSPAELQLGVERAKLLPKPIQGPLAQQDQTSWETKLILAKESLESKAARRSLSHPGRPYVEFQPGDLVLLRANPISSVLRAETKKFLLLFEGPYKVKKMVSYATYVLIYPDSLKERGIFHASHLKRFYQLGLSET